MLSQPRRLGSVLPGPLTRLESAWVAWSASIISTRAPSRAAASAMFSAAMLRSVPSPAPIAAITGIALAGERRVTIARISRMALRKVVSGKPARSVGQPIRVASGMPPMVRIPPSVRTTSDSCSRAISGFSIGAR